MDKNDKPELHVVSKDGPVDKVSNAIMEEIQEENDLLDELEEKIRQHKRQFIRKVFIITAAVVLSLTGGFVYVSNQTYHRARIINTYNDEIESGEQYEQFAGGILKYTRDGASYVDKKGREKWTASYQMKTPIISVKGNSAAIADSGGNDISVFGEKGFKGEIHTSLPIEKIAVSSQGVVSTILKDGSSFQVVCYDAAGNILVEHKTAPLKTGYPLDIDISEDGYMLLVSYLLVENGTLTGRAAYYNFDKGGQDKTDNIVMEEKYANAVVPTVFFFDDIASAVVSDNALTFYAGRSVPRKVETVEFKSGIKSVFHDDKYVGVICNVDGKNTIQLYTKRGQQVLSQEFEGEYRNVKIENGQVIMYDGKTCSIFTKRGVHRFEGELDTDILNIQPLFGINKYLVINANGMEEIRFAK